MHGRCVPLLLALCHHANAATDDDWTRTGSSRFKLALGGALMFNCTNPPCESYAALTSQLGYSFRIARRIEIGTDLRYWHAEAHPIHHGEVGVIDEFVFAVNIRPYIPLSSGDQVELGFGIHVGVDRMTVRDVSGSSVGMVVSYGPDLRVWLTENFAFEVGVEGIMGSGGGLSGLGGWLGGVGGF